MPFKGEEMYGSTDGEGNGSQVRYMIHKQLYRKSYFHGGKRGIKRKTNDSNILAVLGTETSSFKKLFMTSQTQ